MAGIASDAIAAGAGPPSSIRLEPLRSTRYALSVLLSRFPSLSLIHAPAPLRWVGSYGGLPCSFAAIEGVSGVERYLVYGAKHSRADLPLAWLGRCPRWVNAPWAHRAACVIIS